MNTRYIIIVLLIVAVAGYFLVISRDEEGGSNMGSDARSFGTHTVQNEETNGSDEQTRTATGINDTATRPASGEQTATDTTASEVGMSNETDAADEETRTHTYDITAKPFLYSVTEIRVKAGDTVKINLTSEKGTHDFVIDELNVASERVNAGETTTVTFVADTPGTYEYYCSVDGHRALGMVGKLIVE